MDTTEMKILRKGKPEWKKRKYFKKTGCQTEKKCGMNI